MKKIIFFATILISINYTTCASQLLNNEATFNNQEQKPLNQNGLQHQASNSQDVSQSVENQLQGLNGTFPQKSNQEVSNQSVEEDLTTQTMSNQIKKQENLIQDKSSQEDESSPQKNNLMNQLGQALDNKYNLQNSKAQFSNEEFNLKKNIENSQPPMINQNLQSNQSSEQDFYNPQDTKNTIQTPDLNKTDKLNTQEVNQLNEHLKQKLQSRINNEKKKQMQSVEDSQDQDLKNKQSWSYPEGYQPQIKQVQEINEPKTETKPVLKKEDGVQSSEEDSQVLMVKDNGSQVNDKKKSEVQLDKDDNKELLRFQKYQNQQHEKSKLLKRKSFEFKATQDNSCNKDLLLAFGLKLDDSRKNGQIEPQPSGVKEKTLCRRNMGTCCNYDEMMSVADQFAETANKFREQFIVLEELYVMFKGTKIFDVLNDLKQVDKCKAMMDSHVLIPKDEDGNSVGTFETTVAIEIQNSVAGLFNEMRRYKKHIISTYGNVVCSICSPSESQYFKLNQEKELYELDITFANCQEIMDLKDFEIRVAEVYQKYLLPLVSVIECQREDEDPKVDEIELDLFIEEKKLFDNCFNDYSLDNPDCQEICTDFDIKTYTFPGNFFKVSKQMLVFFFNKFAGGNVNEYYQDFKDKDFNEFADLEKFVFYPQLKVPKVETDIYKAEIKLVESRGINITNDYINRIFLEHNQHKSNGMINIVFSMIVLIFL